MSSEKDLLEIYKERIAKESKRGDKAEALRRTTITQPTYDAGFEKAKYLDLSDKETIVIEAHIQILDERKEEVRRKKEQYATN